MVEVAEYSWPSAFCASAPGCRFQIEIVCSLPRVSST